MEQDVIVEQGCGTFVCEGPVDYNIQNRYIEFPVPPAVFPARLGSVSLQGLRGPLVESPALQY